MKRVFNLIFGAFAMFLIALLAAFASMRLAIHGREVSVPNLANLTDTEAAATARKLGLNLSIENRFYSAAVLPNHVLSQSPLPGATVRRGWQVRVTESLGGQRVSVPDVTGQSERPASLILRRLQLELGTVAHLPAPSPAGIVLAQSPPPNSTGLNGPRVALLLADDEAPSATAYVMPSITGISLAAASSRLATVGLHIAGALDPAALPPPIDPSVPTPNAATDPNVPPDVAPQQPVSPTAIITSQSPAPGHRVSRADAIRVTVAHPVEVQIQP